MCEAVFGLEGLSLWRKMLFFSGLLFHSSAVLCRPSIFYAAYRMTNKEPANRQWAKFQRCQINRRQSHDSVTGRRHWDIQREGFTKTKRNLLGFVRGKTLNEEKRRIIRTMKLNGTTMKLDFTHCSTGPEYLNNTMVIAKKPDTTVTTSTSSPSQSERCGTQCSICADRASGKHYGASSCDGCKGFFRRSIRNNHTYHCRFNQQCTVDKDKRNQCRYCRLQKCIKAGMRKGAVQSERDCISSHRVKDQAVTTLSINVLLQAEASGQQLHTVPCCSRGPALLSPPSPDINTKREACVADVFQSMKHQLLLLVQWAKHIPEFCGLALEDRITLLRSHSAKHLILGAAKRSLPYNSLILLGNDFVIPLRGAQMEVSRVAVRIQEELVKPLRELDVNDTDFALLKTIVFFNPDSPGLASPHLVRNLRFQAQLLLEESTSEQRGRFGELLLILPAVQSVAWQMVETLHFAQLLGEARMDSLLQEMLLGEGAPPGQEVTTLMPTQTGTAVHTATPPMRPHGTAEEPDHTKNHV